jgi:hypothetical protein
MSTHLKFPLLGAFVLPLLTTSASAVTIVSTDRLDFLSHFSSTFVEDFDDGLVNAPISVVSTNGVVSGTHWSDVIDAPGLTTWSFVSPIFGFGGDWDLAGPAGPGTGIQVTLNLFGGGTEVFEIPNSTAGTFWGAISTLPFVSAVLTEGSDPFGARETYTLDGLTIGSDLTDRVTTSDGLKDGVTPVPIPAALPLFTGGLLGLGFLGWRRRTRTADIA